MRDFRLYLLDIIAAIDRIEQFTEGMDLTAFRMDDKTTSAVLQKLEVVGEATKQIPKEIRQKNPQLPWKEMAGMRDKLIHFYFGIDYELVWKAIHNRLPHVKQGIKKLLADMEQ